MANNRNYSTSRTSDAPLTREEFFREPSQGRYQTRIRTEGSLAAQPEEVYVPRRRPRQGESGQAKRRPTNGHDRGTQQRSTARSTQQRSAARSSEQTRAMRQSGSQSRSIQTRATQSRSTQTRATQSRSYQVGSAATHRETEEERRARLRRERQRRLAEERRRQEQTETARLRRSAAKAPEKEQGVMSDQREERSSVSSGNRMSFGSKFGFLLSAAIIMIGCMMIVLSYVRIFNKNSEIASLKQELTTVQETNKVAQQRQAETMNMNELYSYAVDTLGMVDAEVDDIITITIVNQSYTTSNLPVADIGESKVRFHWWFE